MVFTYAWFGNLIYFTNFTPIFGGIQYPNNWILQVCNKKTILCKVETLC